MKNRVFIIAGPTGIGKTEFSFELAKKVNGEIVNIDMGQFYDSLSIGTAKPNLDSVPIKHHLFDLLKKPTSLTVTEYRKILSEKVKDLHNKNITPILVGGSNFYILSLFYPPIEIAEKSHNRKVDLDSGNLYQKLEKIDPERAIELDPNDTYRIERALQIYNTTGLKPSSLKPKLAPLFDDVSLIILERNRSELYDRINERTLEMIKNGWLKEVDNLSDNWKHFLSEKKIIGYDIILNYLNGKILNKDELVSKIQKATRNYAKRQVTFLKKLEKDIKKIENKLSINIFKLNLSDKEYILKKDELLNKLIK